MCVKRDINTSKQHFKTEIYKSSKIYKRDVLKMRQINVERNMNTPKQHFKRELCSSTETYKKDVLTIQKRRIDDADAFPVLRYDKQVQNMNTSNHPFKTDLRLWIWMYS